MTAWKRFMVVSKRTGKLIVDSEERLAIFYYRRDADKCARKLRGKVEIIHIDSLAPFNPPTS